MKTIPIHNTSTQPMYVGATMIEPGETRVFEAHELPPGYEHYQPKAAADETPPPQPGTLESLQGKPVNELLAALPTLTGDELDQLEAAEKALKKPRKQVLAALAEQRLVRAKAAEIDKRVAEFRTAIADFSASELTELLKDYADGEPEKAVLQDEIEKRNAAAQ